MNGGEKLNRHEFVALCNLNLKAVRNEFSFSQEKMALMLGISKKTLVEIEKGRSSLGWSGSVVLCAVFSESNVLIETFLQDPVIVFRSIAFEKSDPVYRQANTHKIWWQIIDENDNYIIEQNIVSQHYRLLTKDNRIVASSFDIDDLKKIMTK